jgi:type IV pilus assembly protein PilQ
VDLVQPNPPRVRSSRNVIFIEADRLDRAAAGVISSVGPSSVIRDLQVERRGTSTAITLQATGRLVDDQREESKEGPARLYVDLANVTSALPGVTRSDKALFRTSASASAKERDAHARRRRDVATSAYHLEPSLDGQSLTMVIDDARRRHRKRRLSRRSQARPSRAHRGLCDHGAGTGAPAAVFAPPPAAPAQAAAPPPRRRRHRARQQPGTQTTQIGPSAPRYTGHPVSLDFQGADLRAVLRTFAEISGLNIVIDPTIQGTVDVSLRDVPWDQALDIILRANKLGYVVDGTIVRVAPLAVLADEETQRRKLADEQALSGELRVYTRSLSYARAEDLRPLLTATVLSSRGSIQTDPRTNTIIINDLPDRLQRAGDLIATLDSPQPQVEIEARVVQTTRQFARTIGVQWGVNGRATNTIGNTTGLAFPNQGSITGRTGATQGPPAPEPQIDAAATAVNLGVTGRKQCGWARDGLGQWRAEPRRRALRAREAGARPAAFDAASDDAEQRRSRDDAGRSDSRFRRLPTTP